MRYKKGIKTAIIVINYNSSADTIECLDSIYKAIKSPFEIYLLDNASSTESFLTLEKYVASLPSENKPHLYRSEMNLGFAAGNSYLVNKAVQDKTIGYFWFLNNDTLLLADALEPMLKELNDDLEIGLLGSKILDYHQPQIIQAVGGRFKVNTACLRLVGEQEVDRGQYDHNRVAIDYPIGASILVRRETYFEIGGMDNKLFLYLEELEWSHRAKQAGFYITYCPKSEVLHKQGASTGTKDKGVKSATSARFEFRNLIYYYRKFYPTLVFLPILRYLVRSVLYSIRQRKNFVFIYFKAVAMAFKMQTH